MRRSLRPVTLTTRRAMSLVPTVLNHIVLRRMSRAPRMPHTISLLVISLVATVLLPSEVMRSVEADSAGVNVTLDGWLGGQAGPVAIDGTTACIGVGPVVQVIDLSNPSAPALAGASPALAAYPVDLAVMGDLVLAAYRTG